MVADENQFYTDDVGLIAGILKDNWSLGPGHEAPIEYKPESFMMNARQGTIYVYQVSWTLRPTSVDARNYEKRSDITIKISNRFREEHFLWAQEALAILLNWRRAGLKKLKGYTRIDITSDHQDRDLSGWYVTSISISMVNHVAGVKSDGFGR